MKKVLIAQPLHLLLEQERSFLDRSDMQVFVASTSDETLALLRARRMDLIVTRSDLPGMDSDGFCSRLREDPELGAVPLIMASPDTPEAIKSGARCRPDVVLPDPVYPVILIAKVREHLLIPARESIRVTLHAEIDIRSHNAAFTCRTRNISGTGILIETDRVLAEGARLFCSFYLPVAQLVEAQGRIVRIIERTPGSDGHQYGLLFLDIAPEMRQRISAYVQDSSAESA